MFPTTFIKNLTFDETIKEILDYSRNARLNAEMTEVNLKDSLEQIFSDLRFVDNQKVEFRMDIQGSPIIRSDKTRIQILLKNIIGNSVKYKKANITDSFVDVNVSRIDDELVDLALLLRLHPVVGIEGAVSQAPARHEAGDFAAQIGGFEFSDGAGTRVPRRKAAPVVVDANA